MKFIHLPLAGLSLLCACSETTPSPAPGTAESTVKAIAVEPVVEKSLLEQVEDGVPMTVTFDQCSQDVDLQGYAPDEAELGVFVCEASYSVRYDKATSQWETSGPDENLSRQSEDGRLVSKTNVWTGPAPLEGVGNIYIWGVRFKVGDDGRIFDRIGSNVGALSIL